MVDDDARTTDPTAHVGRREDEGAGLTGDDRMLADGGEPTDDERRCDFCRLRCPEDLVSLEMNGTTYCFCCETCRDAMLDSDRVFTEYHGHRRFEPGVSALDAALPKGLPRSSFVLLAGQAGTRDGALHAELVWRALRRGEPAVYVSFQEPPASVVASFLAMDWNVMPYLESGDLQILDCFTYRLDDRERMFDRMSKWSSHLHEVAAPATTALRDPTDLGEIENKLDNCLESAGMVEEGIVLMDSLTELGTLVQPVQAYDFVKDVRADVCKGRYVPVFAGATYSGESDTFPHDLDYIVDGLVDMELNGNLVEDVLVKRIRIRKMSGGPSIPQWSAYEYQAGDGLLRVSLEPDDASGDAGEGDDAGDADASGETDDDSSDVDTAVTSGDETDETDT